MAGNARSRSTQTNPGGLGVALEVTFRGRAITFHGFLFAKTKVHVILVNHVRDGAELGPLKKIRREHLYPEADVFVFPLKTIKEIKFYR
jgi:hypothetical protein